MPTDHRARLATIKRFDQLIAYLRDEMGWPIARDSFEDVDDLFYDFTADELGIDPKTAAKIQEHQAAAATFCPPALGHLLRQVRAEEAPGRGAAPHPEPGGAQEARLRQQRRAGGMGRGRPALHLQLRRGRGAPDQLRALLEGAGRPRPAHPQGARLGQPRHGAAPRRRCEGADAAPRLARRRRRRRRGLAQALARRLHAAPPRGRHHLEGTLDPPGRAGPQHPRLASSPRSPSRPTAAR